MIILDCNDFWSPTGGGVRRYHLEKMSHLAKCENIDHIFIMPDKQTYTERSDVGTVIEHIRAVKKPGAGDYRYTFNLFALRQIIKRHQPDVIEIGSPLFSPWIVRLALWGINPRPVLIGFWHSDFPRTEVGRVLRKWSTLLGNLGEQLAWLWMRQAYRSFETLFVSSHRVGSNLLKHGFTRLYYTPLGVDAERFHPQHRDEKLVSHLKAGIGSRISIFFPHRLPEEKGVGSLLTAYPKICNKLPHPPALVFAGIGPEQTKVEAAATNYPHIHYLGYIDQPDEIARWYASCDMSIALSNFETFGLSIAEAMASGLAIVGANGGGGAELIEDSKCGFTVPYENVEALVEAVVNLVKEGQLDKRGLRGREYISRFTWESAFNNELDCYRHLLEQIREKQPSPHGFHNLLEMK